MIYLAEHQPNNQPHSRDHYLEQLRAIHAMKQDIGLDDEQYRDILESLTGYRSSKDMTPLERDRVIGYFTALLDLALWVVPRCINQVRLQERIEALKRVAA